MKVSIPAGKARIESEGKTVKDIFKELAEAAEVFGDTACGLCGSPDIIPKVRHVDGYDFFEYSCQKSGCGAKLAFGQIKDKPSLFPKRKINEKGEPDMDEGKFDFEHRGWHKWKPTDQPPVETQPKTTRRK